MTLAPLKIFCYEYAKDIDTQSSPDVWVTLYLYGKPWR